MEKQVKSAKKLRQRKFFLALPALTLPFITLIFWAFGGGKVENSSAQGPQQTGLILDLPDASFKDDQALTKLDFYNKAKADSAKIRDLIRNDPNYRSMAFDGNLQPAKDELNTSLNSSGRYNDANEEKIYQKLAELDRELNRPYDPEPYGVNSSAGKQSSNIHSADIDRLEQMMQSMADSAPVDEEMRQINSVLESILDIQYPERVQQRLSENNIQQRGRVYPVIAAAPDASVSLIRSQVEDSQVGSNGFYSLVETYEVESIPNTIQAVVHETQTVVTGSTLKLRLLNDVVVNSQIIPKGNFVYGIAQLNGERLAVKINEIRYDRFVLPVDLSVHDMDGLHGIHIPNAISRDAAKESADRSIQTIGLTAVDPSWGAKAATAGIQAAKTLLSKRVKLVRVTVKAGYQVLLRDQKQKED